MTITGAVSYQDFEGGFWGIVGDDDNKYRPVDDLPTSFKKAGCRIKAEVEPANVMSFTMWGENVKILHIEKI